MSLPRPARTRFDPRGLLPETVEDMRIEGTVRFDAPWDLDALAIRRPQPRQVEIDDLHALWGGLDLRVVGGFDIDAAGTPEGRLTVKAVNWRDMLDVLQSNGTLPAEFGPLARAALETLAGASGRADTLDAPLTLSGGLIRLGPIPIGPAPRMHLR